MLGEQNKERGVEVIEYGNEQMEYENEPSPQSAYLISRVMVRSANRSIWPLPSPLAINTPIKRTSIRILSKAKPKKEA